MLNIIITLDYEIFSGKGDVKKHLIQRTDKILKIAGEFKVPMTIMFEICEYLMFEAFDEQLSKDLGYSPAKLIREQIIKAFKNGHDVQLHIHPQWIDARYKDKKWEIRTNERDISKFSNEDIYKILKQGKDKLISILREADPGYECVAIRFTGNWEEAPPKTLPVLEELGIKVHSLADGCPQDNKKGHWALGGSGKVAEIPIYSVMVPKYRAFLPRRVIAALYMCSITDYGEELRSKARGTLLKAKGNLLLGLFRETYSQKWDFCKQSAGEMVDFLEVALERFDCKNNEVPLVMIGHSKDFLFEKDFEKFIRIVSEKYLSERGVRFSTFQEFIKNNI